MERAFETGVAPINGRVLADEATVVVAFPESWSAEHIKAAMGYMAQAHPMLRFVAIPASDHVRRLRDALAGLRNGAGCWCAISDQVGNGIPHDADCLIARRTLADTEVGRG